MVIHRIQLGPFFGSIGLFFNFCFVLFRIIVVVSDVSRFSYLECVNQVHSVIFLFITSIVGGRYHHHHYQSHIDKSQRCYIIKFIISGQKTFLESSVPSFTFILVYMICPVSSSQLSLTESSSTLQLISFFFFFPFLRNRFFISILPLQSSLCVIVTYIFLIFLFGLPSDFIFTCYWFYF